MFTGLSAFPLTPLRHDIVDESAYAGLVARLAEAGVDSIGALGSTGSYAYLDRDERRQAVRVAVENAGVVPVIVGIGATRTSHVQAFAEDAQHAGAAAVLLAPLSYQPLTEDEVFGLYEDVTAGLSVPLVVYDNPSTTRFTFSDDLYASVAKLPHVASIKIPGVPDAPDAARARVDELRGRLPDGVTIGVSGDALGAIGMNAGSDAWYSVIGGVLPMEALAITRAARAGDAAAAIAASDRLQPIWDLFDGHGGSLRVAAAIAEHLGLVAHSSLPRPIRGLGEAQRTDVGRVVDGLLSQR
ncbi:dihydrodipicolinate synthase family protein [Naasia sp. SYSU D00948]|uniref:dihydrodipicolinate synthase family protein n=1 Tax=Naasia sp. SYSU D00948 TaxID=2817379 RepID=UPI001B30039F|nr:dihydrodipicolinate synthase family protein [Naasia sp. SYSU D00948]